MALHQRLTSRMTKNHTQKLLFRPRILDECPQDRNILQPIFFPHHNDLRGVEYQEILCHWPEAKSSLKIYSISISKGVTHFSSQWVGICIPPEKIKLPGSWVLVLPMIYWPWVSHLQLPSDSDNNLDRISKDLFKSKRPRQLRTYNLIQPTCAF